MPHLALADWLSFVADLISVAALMISTWGRVGLHKHQTGDDHRWLHRQRNGGHHA